MKGSQVDLLQEQRTSGLPDIGDRITLEFLTQPSTGCAPFPAPPNPPPNLPSLLHVVLD